MDERLRIEFLNRFRAARERVLKDSEAFLDMVRIIESFGLCLGGKGGVGLADYRECIAEQAEKSPLAAQVPGLQPAWHSTFADLFQIVKDARNEAVHEGSYARHLSIQAVRLSIVLEDAILAQSNKIGDYMVRSPVTAELWHPLSFVRQTMIENSFSHLPVYTGGGEGAGWKLVSDHCLALYLNSGSRSERQRRMAQSLEHARDEDDLILEGAFVCRDIGRSVMEFSGRRAGSRSSSSIRSQRNEYLGSRPPSISCSPRGKGSRKRSRSIRGRCRRACGSPPAWASMRASRSGHLAGSARSSARRYRLMKTRCRAAASRTHS